MPSDTRARLVDAAWTCIRNGGPTGATSRAITAAADANLGAITYYFGSKDALVAEAVGAAIEALIRPALDALEDDAVDPAARVFNAVAELQRAHERAVDDAPVYLEVLTQSRRRPELAARIGQVFDEARSALTTLMAGLQANGVLPAWVEPATMAGLLLAVAQGVVLQSTIDPGGPTLAAMANQFARVLVASRADQP